MTENVKQIKKFTIADNEMSEPDVEYIVHTQEPRFIAKRVFDNPMTDFEIVDEIDDFMKFFAGRPERMAGLMRRLGDWYVSYLEWEDKNMQDNDEE